MSSLSHSAGQGTEAQGEKATRQAHTAEVDVNTGHLAPFHPVSPPRAPLLTPHTLPPGPSR